MDIDFTGFVGDCLVSGRLDLQAGRLTDQLNGSQQIHLRDVVLEGLDGGRVETDAFAVDRAQLCAAIGTGPRGTQVLRVPTDARRLQAQVGPYMVLGRYHGPVGGTNLRTFSERDPLVPLTDATIAYVVNGILEVRDADVLIVNRELAAWYRDRDDEAALPPSAQIGRDRRSARSMGRRSDADVEVEMAPGPGRRRA